MFNTEQLKDSVYLHENTIKKTQKRDFRSKQDIKNMKEYCYCLPK